MTSIRLVGRPSLNFYGKYIAEIAKNLKSRAQGRLVVKESEEKFKEPCFYIIKKIEPLMSDQSHVRCRALGERIYRGRSMGKFVRFADTHEPDWRLLSPAEAKQLKKTYQEFCIESDSLVVKDKPLPSVSQMPSSLAYYLTRTGRLSYSSRIDPNEISSYSKGLDKLDVRPLILLQLPRDQSEFWTLLKPTKEEITHIHPPYIEQTQNDLSKTEPCNSYYIRRSDSPGIFWRVDLGPEETHEGIDDTCPNQ